MSSSSGPLPCIRRTSIAAGTRRSISTSRSPHERRTGASPSYVALSDRTYAPDGIGPPARRTCARATPSAPARKWSAVRRAFDRRGHRIGRRRPPEQEPRAAAGRRQPADLGRRPAVSRAQGPAAVEQRRPGEAPEHDDRQRRGEHRRRTDGFGARRATPGPAPRRAISASASATNGKASNSIGSR